MGDREPSHSDDFQRMGSARWCPLPAAVISRHCECRRLQGAKALSSLTGAGTNVAGPSRAIPPGGHHQRDGRTSRLPAGATLTIQPGTHVSSLGRLSFSGGASVDSNGIDIIVNGNLQALGHARGPISVTCSAAENRWGSDQIRDAVHFDATLRVAQPVRSFAFRGGTSRIRAVRCALATKP